MVSSRSTRGALVILSIALALAGCAQSAPEALRSTSSAPPSSTGTPTSTPAMSAPPVSEDPTPSAPPAGSADPVAGLASAVNACQAVANGFSAAGVAAAAPLAAEAASHDPVWTSLAEDLEFIRSNPIDPETGAGSQKTVDDASAVAEECFSRAGVQVSQD
ncbi:hypothetical protein LLS1_28660 [Leifsonia sp. LS1]|uniref:hypothetical protein n=1 Tax=Leifsonia sp. LS1 TaxID=2828483 RepID=UPI001CFC9A8F|nr:hypothetical protein [Leifsonia sp. LS1]GIT81197.1 hypothetical protein LLS1_28660 [Leifsonia sp. LS1]